MYFLYDPVKRSTVKNYIDQYLINNQTFVDHLALPIYRFYNPTSAKHLFTVSSTAPPPIIMKDWHLMHLHIKHQIQFLFIDILIQEMVIIFIQKP